MGASIVELEATTAFLLDPTEISTARFYYRDPKFAVRMQEDLHEADEEERNKNLGMETADQDDQTDGYLDSIETRAMKANAMKSLKTRILAVDHGAHVQEYDVPNRLGKMLLSDLTAAFHKCRKRTEELLYAPPIESNGDQVMTSLSNELYVMKVMRNKQEKMDTLVSAIAEPLQENRLSHDYARGNVSMSEVVLLSSRMGPTIWTKPPK